MNALTAINFQDSETLIVFIVLVVLSLCLAFIFLFLFIFHFSNKSFQKKLNDKSNSLRSFIIYYKDNNVTYFNLSNIKLRYMTLESFYSQFALSERDRVKEWVSSLLTENNKQQDFIETETLLSRSKKTVFVLLKVISLNKEKSIIHLESYILRNVPSKSNSKRRSFSTVEEASKAMLHSPIRGATFGIQFYNSSDSKKFQGIPGPLFSQLKNVALNFVSPSRYLIEMSSSRLVMIDLRVISDNSMRSIQQTMTASFNKFLTMNSYSNSIKVAFSYIPNREFPRDAATLTQKASKLAIQAADRKIMVLPYDETQVNVESDKTIQIEDIDNLIRHKLVYSFSPIASAKDENVLGYFGNVVSGDQALSSMDEVRQAAEKAKKRKSLFSIIGKQFFSTFKNQTNSIKGTHKLFYDVFMEDYDFLGKTLDSLWGLNPVSKEDVPSKSKLILQFHEEELTNYSEDPDLYNDLIILKDKYELSLVLENNNEFSLSDEIMKLFDYFVFDLGSVDVKNDERTNFRVMSKAGKILRYARPIIMRRIENWSTIELVVRNGINYVSGTAISVEDGMIHPLDKKILEKLNKIVSN
jgi:hypothetical protein